MSFPPYAESETLPEPFGGTDPEEADAPYTEPEDDGTETGPDTDQDTVNGSSSAKAKAARPSKSAYRRTAAKAVEVHTAGDSVRGLAAAVLGGSADTAELTAAIMTAPRGAGAALESIQEIAEVISEDPMEAALMAVELGREIKPAWALMHALEAVGSPAPPAADAKAARQLVKAIGALSDDQVLDLAAAAELIKRS